MEPIVVIILSSPPEDEATDRTDREDDYDNENIINN